MNVLENAADACHAGRMTDSLAGRDLQGTLDFLQFGVDKESAASADGYDAGGQLQ